MRRFSWIGVLTFSAWLACGGAGAAELTPLLLETPLGQGGPRIGHYSERTVVAAIEIDRQEARLLGFTYKSRPFLREVRTTDISDYDERQQLQLEVVLVATGGDRYTQRVEAGPLCLLHGAETEPHVAGDTIRLHRDSIVVELPEVAGFDRVEVAYYEQERGTRTRRLLGTPHLNRARFDPAGRPIAYGDLLFADPEDTSVPLTPLASDVEWPEDHGDPDHYKVFGDETEGGQRINIVIVPDGYLYAEKELMEAHATEMVEHFRAKPPFAQHDPFMNYTLVYAYSPESGTDQCDCDIVVNTAMGTRFLEPNPICGHSDNRCLFYGGGCDTSGTGNISAAELRAPFQDETIVMVNTERYGGCGGFRAVYSAGNSAARELAVHELGHSLGNLDDEYEGNPGCGFGAGEINTSTNAIQGAWPEWIPVLGAPREGARYYEGCIFRPFNNCEMRSLNQPFCIVCNQHWALLTFTHHRVNPTAPITAQSPEPSITTLTGMPVEFFVDTRLPSGPINEFAWTIKVPGFSDPFDLNEDGPSHTRSFSVAGSYELSVTVTADTIFVHPSKNGPNRESAVWTIDAYAPPREISPPGAPDPLRFTDRETLTWEDGSSKGASSYNLYRAPLSGPAAGDFGECIAQGLLSPSGPAGGNPPAGLGLAYLVTGANPAAEGPMGQTSSGELRSPTTPCAD